MIAMKRTWWIVLLCAVVAALLVVQVCAHSGRTDANGGHHDRINGGYHYHHGKPAHQHPNGVCPYDAKTTQKTPTTTERAEVSAPSSSGGGINGWGAAGIAAGSAAVFAAGVFIGKRK